MHLAVTLSHSLNASVHHGGRQILQKQLSRIIQSPRQTEAVPPRSAANLKDTCAWLGVEHSNHQLADGLLILIKGRELPIERSVVDALGYSIIFNLCLFFHIAQVGRPE